MSQQAIFALRAIEIHHRQGPYPAKCFANRHGVRSLYRLALQLEAVKNI